MSSDQISFPRYIQSGMILQRQVAFRMRGQAIAGITLDLEIERHPAGGENPGYASGQFGRVHKDSTICDEKGRFSFLLPAFEASFNPLTITVRAVANASTAAEKPYIRTPGSPRPLPNIVVLDDILVGEVWVSGGQDNMVLPLSVADGGEYRHLCDQNDSVRFFLQNEEGKEDDEPFSFLPRKTISNGRWTRAGRIIDLRQISAVAAWFAHELNRRMRVPVGIVSTEVNASLIHSWIDRDRLKQSEAVQQHLKRVGLQRNDENWEEEGDSARFQPSVFYNHKIAPLKGLSCRGFLWYQGESDIAFPEYYRVALPLLIESWKDVFVLKANTEPAFIYSLLAPYYYASLKADALPRFNLMLTEMRKKLKVPAAVIALHDLPTDYDKLPEDWKHPLHPQVKRPIGERMANAALGLVYAQKAPPTSPELNQVKKVGNKFMLTFHHTFSNLRLKGQDTTLRGFSITGEDKRFHPAMAKLLYGVQVMVWHPDVQDPAYIQYGMSELNGSANLVSEDNMAAVPFTTVPEGPVVIPDMSMLNLDDLTIWAYSPTDLPDPLPDTAAKLSRYRADKGAKVHYQIEKANRLEGEAATSIQYESDSPRFKILVQDTRYPSLRPKLDLSIYEQLSIRVFNLDARQKALRLCGQGEWKTIESGLSWQELVFEIADDFNSDALYFELEDKLREGELVLDQIQLRYSR